MIALLNGLGFIVYYVPPTAKPLTSREATNVIYSWTFHKWIAQQRIQFWPSDFNLVAVTN